MWPHYHCGKGKLGHLVYYERPGEFEGAQLAARGVTVDILVRHWIFMAEYQWKILCNDDETAKVRNNCLVFLSVSFNDICLSGFLYRPISRFSRLPLLI
jgi:predicted nucleotidyltransferase